MKKRIYLLPIMVLTAMLALTGCGDTETAAQRAIRESAEKTVADTTKLLESQNESEKEYQEKMDKLNR